MIAPPAASGQPSGRRDKGGWCVNLRVPMLSYGAPVGGSVPARAFGSGDMAEKDPPEVAARAVAGQVRRLMRAADRATLATRLIDGDWPYASLVMTACALDCTPLLLLSDLAEHGKNLAADSRASLLFDGTSGRDNPLTGLRATAVGRIQPSGDRAPLERYVRRHPDAAMYAGFRDFRLYLMRVERVHAVAGFGAIHWLAGKSVLYPAETADALAAAETDILAHMNDDHAEAVGLYATQLLGFPASDWKLTGIDPEGIDLRAGGMVARVDFGHPIAGPEDARRELAALARKARQRL